MVCAASRTQGTCDLDFRNVESLRRALDAGSSAEFLFFWGHTPKGSAIGKHVLSQWWPAVFSVENQVYCSAEHYMMARKAELFGDDETLAAIVSSGTPAEAKALGRQVRGFDERVWRDHRFQIAVRGNTAKFSQNPELKEWLIGTDNLVLVEASPVDRVWGIGLAADDSRALDPRTWRGLNLLGFALMEVRTVLGPRR